MPKTIEIDSSSLLYIDREMNFYGMTNSMFIYSTSHCFLAVILFVSMSPRHYAALAEYERMPEEIL